MAINPLIVNNLIDSCAFDPKYYPENEASEKIYPGEYQVRTEYAAGKMLGEIITVNKAKVSDLRYQIIRQFN